MGWLSMPIAACLESLGLLEAVEEDVDEAAGRAVAAGGAVRTGDGRTEQHPAKQLARALYGPIPVIYGAELTAVAALRWKCQINENAKALAFNQPVPGTQPQRGRRLGAPGRADSDFRVIYLRDARHSSPEQQRMDVTAELLQAVCGDIREYSSSGQSRLAPLLSSIYLGDFVSLYLAILYGIDPSPVERIENLKQRLA